eukprot:jgi/Chlat1/7433/Chrsp6S07452
MLWLIGLGLGDEEDITLKGLKAVKGCQKVYLEMYTSVLGVDKAKLEALYEKDVIVADREMVEQQADEILTEAQSTDVAFLVVGDPFGATTHADLLLRARAMGVKVSVVHNASILNAVGACGLQLYRFGETVSIPFFTDTWRPDSFYDRIQANRSRGLHTLCLLDIKVKEPSMEALCRGRKEYEPPRYMSVSVAAEQLLEVEDKRQEGAYGRETTAVGLARIGLSTQQIVAGTLEDLLTANLGAPLHSLVIAGDLHVLEQEMLDSFKVT